MNGRQAHAGQRVRLSRRQQMRLGGLIGAGFLICYAPLWADGGTTPGKAAIVPIRGEITDVMKESIDTRLDKALADGAKTIIFEIDTPGGQVISAMGICQRIKDLPADVQSVAWVKPKAYSAGSMIALSCRRIIMSPRSSIGDCAPIAINPAGGLEPLPATERAKASSPILEEFRDSASRNHYDPVLAQAMVSIGQEVWWIENITTGERRFVFAKEKTELVDKPDAGKAEWRLVEKYVDPLSQKEQAARQPVNSESELITLTQSEAVAYGLAKGIAGDVPALAERLELSAPPVYFEITAWDKFVMWLNSPIVRGILFAIVIIGAYVEFQHPGLILPGSAAALALIVFLAAPYAAGLASIWTFVLLGIGLLLIAFEVFVAPGHGVSAIVGALLILVAVIGTFVPGEPSPTPGHTPWFSWPSLPGTWRGLERGILVLSLTLLASMVGILLALKLLPRLPVARGMVIPNPDGATLALADPYAGVALEGDVGVVTGDLRPGGQARFGQHVVDVQSQGEYVEAGRRVVVLKHEGMTVTVRPLPDDSQA